MRTGADVRFQVLGPWEVTGERGPVTIPAGRMRVLLASLMVSIERAVPIKTLAERVWPERRPSRVQDTVYTYVARLRRLLGQDAIQTTPGHYQLAVAPHRIDLWLFRDLLRRARAAGEAHLELDLLRQAQALWRGQPFTGVDSTWLDHEVSPLMMDEWFSATERRIDLEMRSNNPGDLVGELRELVTAYPAREPLWVRLVAALHRSGRRAEALDAYQQAREVLTAELGREPGDALRRTHRQVLLDGAADDSTATAGTARGMPVCRLPRDLTTFRDRAELAQLRLLTATIERNERLTHIVVIEGPQGVGKTTLAVHWAHQVAAAYPDLRMHLDLRGSGPGEPMTASAALEALLRGVGVPTDLIPPGADERAALLRGTLAGRRVLLLLDNARDANQVRPMLPGGDSLVVVTSRARLRGLSIRDGARRVTVGPLPPHEALAPMGGP